MAKRTVSVDLGDFIVVEDDTKPVDVISTGCLSLDACIGVGGIPRGKFTEIYGPESAGKTTLSLSIARNAIEKDLKVFYVDIEHGLDFRFIKQAVGNDYKSKFDLVQPETAEEALMLIEEAIASGDYGLIVLDSVGALAPEEEKNKGLTEYTMSLIPRILSRFSRRSAFHVHKNNVAVVMVNQVRDKFGTYVATLETPGGHTIKHLYSLRVSLFYPQKIKQGEEIIGTNTNFTIKKNKLAPDGRGFYFSIIHGKGLDYVRDVVNFGVELGVITKSGSWLSFAGNNLAQGVDKTVKFLEENEETLDKIKKEVYNTVNDLNLSLTGKESDEQDD